MTIDRPGMTPVISLSMPWANWVGLRWKTIETRKHRRFQSLVGKRIGVHCSATWDTDAIKHAASYLTDNQLAITRQFLKIGGCICWTAFVSEFRRATVADEPRALIECSTERWALVLADIQTLEEAVPMKGHQGIWYANIELD